MTLDIEGVLAGHPQENGRPKHHDGDPWKYDGTYVCPCGEEYEAAPGIGGAFRGHRAHVAAVVREQIAAWLTAEGKREMHERGGHWHTVTASDVHVARKLDALAAQVARVDPSRSESGSTDPEVRQSADRTSSPSRVPGEES